VIGFAAPGDRGHDPRVTTRNILCAFPAPIPVGHDVEVTVFESVVHVTKGLFTETTRVDRKPAPYLPLVRDLDTGIVYADQSHFEGADGGDGSPEAVEAHRVTLRDRLLPSPTLAAVETVRGRVTECAVIGNVWVYPDDRRAHTRLVVELDAAGYRG
jgi:hypothetical protein